MNQDLAIIALGIALGMVFFQRTGFSAGGIISPGILALNMSSFYPLVWTVVSSLFVFFLLEICVRFPGLYGRQRVATALLLAALLRLAAGDFLPFDPVWLGWVIPGLVAADVQRQGILPTFSGLIAVSGTTFLIGGFLL
ncbi:MAG TPA: poly-gamma-glutamate biosynthesis protein PgsC/CapC [Synergistales bacterium]|nr:poly-gamma-glutamate biosynthesis protein PgsC/CapC [Synergistales bacterium]HRV70913.1 poly-gamma-glutamate biosynthesis protein PgsC/CapC [Thermovirgaceae bacterium]